jgi:cbb3-type cytochrome oxidase maturation protein
LEHRQKSSHMKIIFFLIATSLLLAVGFLAAFFWAVRGGQYEDEYTPSVRILFDDASKHVAGSKTTTTDNHPNDKPTAKPKSQTGVHALQG